MSQVKEESEYSMYTGPAELHKAINTLRGIIAGIVADRTVEDAEMDELVNWCSLHKHLENRHPFSELMPLIEQTLEDGVISSDESQDILWLCNNFAVGGAYYDFLTSSVQFLAGLLHGLLADGELSDCEILSLRKWLDANMFLRGCYPFDEIDSLLANALADGKIDDDERKMLLAFLSNFVDAKSSLHVNDPQMQALREQYSVPGICAYCPDITVPEKTFCVTGTFQKGGVREDIWRIIQEHGGKVVKTPSRNTDYVVVGSVGNSLWAYACYGRKIEQAIELRKKGNKITIVNELDFWDAIED